MIKNSSSLTPLIDLHINDRSIDWQEEFCSKNPLVVEIGFGLGEFLVAKAYDDQKTNYIGIENNWERLYKALKKIAEGKSEKLRGNVLENVRVLRMDAWQSFQWLFKPRSIQQIFCLFPCPWPKKKHVKYRLFSGDFLKLLNNRLKQGGVLTVVTDHYPYYEWIVQQSSQTGFALTKKTTQPRFHTKFERKWLEAGQKDFFELHLSKQKHIPGNINKGAILKSYRLKHFDPRQFVMKEIKGDVSIIFKELLFDEKEQKVMIHVLVSEEHLLQHFWVSVRKEKMFWRLFKSDGQKFYPTQGIAKALEAVYQAARKSA